MEASMLRHFSAALCYAALTLLGLHVWAGGIAARGQSQEARPNVVLIITDDAGYGDFGSYGATDVKTPHIDSIVRDGVRLTDFYANGPTCSPTRTGLISGRYQQRYGIELPLGAGGKADQERGLTPAGTSLPQLLTNNGYMTALIGKWHLGWRSALSPNAHGFAYFFGFKSGYVDYYQHTTGGNAPIVADFFENDRAVEVPGYMTDLITDRSVRFIEENARRPFFLDISYNAVHWPYQRPDSPSKARDNGRHILPLDEQPPTRADYIAMLERADQGVGRVLAALDKAGVRQNTLVIFTNDNGGEWLSRNTPLFHHKGTVWEGGIRVPAMFRWPARLPSRRVSRQVGITMDLTASILAATGTEVPADARHEGIDLLPILAGRTAEVERTLFWRVPPPQPQHAVRWGDWKLLLDGGRALLFNLRQDSSERNNLIAQHADIAQRLSALLKTWTADVDSEAKRATSVAAQH
jgi:arylsulfatase A-like enzyme